MAHGSADQVCGNVTEENGQFIKQACNSHDALLAACQELFALVVDKFTEPERQQLLDAARAAIAKAESK